MHARVARSSVSLETVLELAQKTAGADVDADAPLMDAGVDSLGAVELRNQLQAAAGSSQSLPSTLVFDHPTARQIASLFIIDTPPLDVVDGNVRSTSSRKGVSVASIQPVLPNGAQSMVALWRKAATGRDAFGESPAMRWDPSSDGPMRYGAFMRNAEQFDPVAFSVSPPEASSMDPQQRNVLEGGYAALCGAGLRRAHLMESNTAVFVGVMSTEFKDAVQHENAYTMTGTGHCFVSGRLSYTLGLQGACEAIDVACSAALVACHSARRAVQNDETDAAVLVGVNMMFLPSTLDSFAAAGLTSPSGKAHVFDSKASGFVRGEACVAGVLSAAARSPLLDVRGTGVGQDGRSASLTAPNGRAQHQLLGIVLADAGLDHVQLVEAAANGSPMGDPIEGSSRARYMHAATLTLHAEKATISFPPSTSCSHPHDCARLFESFFAQSARLRRHSPRKALSHAMRCQSVA